MLTLEVRTKTIGSIKAEGPEFLTLNVLEEERLTVAELIRRTVEEGIREEAVRRMKDIAGTKEASQYSGLSMPDAKAQVQKALRAFQVGTYIVLIDNSRIKTLDEEIVFSPSTSIQFVRLTPLVGG